MPCEVTIYVWAELELYEDKTHKLGKVSGTGSDDQSVEGFGHGLAAFKELAALLVFFFL